MSPTPLGPLPPFLPLPPVPPSPSPPPSRRSDSLSRSVASSGSSAITAPKYDAPVSRSFLSSIMCFAAIVTCASTAIFIVNAPHVRALAGSRASLTGAPAPVLGHDSLPRATNGTGNPVAAATTAPTAPGAARQNTTATRPNATKLREPRSYPRIPDQASRIFAPSLRGPLGLKNANRTVFIRDELCTYQYNYVCKFWFHVRCHLFAAFANVVALPFDTGEMMMVWDERARPGDILVISWRGLNHTQTPDILLQALAWRDARRAERDPRASVRIGVLHIANERNRENWPWYRRADFVLRNYWTTRSSPHVQYVPLGGQVPAACPSDRSGESAGFRIVRYGSATEESVLDERLGHAGGTAPTKGPDACACGGVRLPRLRERPLLWSFSGSLRNKRGGLIAALRRDEALYARGAVHIAMQFGGDGQVGARNDPKNAYLQSVMRSQLVLCPCGNVMETHRIYEALNHGAIPVIQACEEPKMAAFFPFTELLVDDDVNSMIDFVRSFADDRPALLSLEKRVMAWWREYTTEVALNVTRVVTEDVPVHLRRGL